MFVSRIRAFAHTSSGRMLCTASTTPVATRHIPNQWKQARNWTILGVLGVSVGTAVYHRENLSHSVYTFILGKAARTCADSGTSAQSRRRALSYVLYPLVFQRDAHTLEHAGECGAVRAALAVADLGDLESLREAAVVLEELMRAPGNRTVFSDGELCERIVQWAKSADETVSRAALGTLVFLTMDSADIKLALLEAGLLPALDSTLKREDGETAQKSLFALANLLKDFPAAYKPKLSNGHTELLMNAAMHMGYSFQQQHAERAAIDLYEQLKAFAPQSPFPYFALGGLYNSIGDVERANTHFREALRVNPQLLDARAQLARNLVESGGEKGKQEAVQLLYKGLALHKFQGNALELYTMLAGVLEDLRRDAEAVRVLRDLLTLQPKNARARSSLGRVLLRKGDVADAEKELEKARKLQPFDASILFHLGVVAQHKHDSGKAEELLREAVRVNASVAGGRGQLLLGKLLMRKGDWEGAGARLCAFSEMAPLLPEAHYEAGVCLEKAGERERALEYFGKAVEAWKMKAGGESGLARYMERNPEDAQAFAKVSKRCAEVSEPSPALVQLCAKLK